MCWEAGALKSCFEEGGRPPLTRVPQTWDVHHP